MKKYFVAAAFIAFATPAFAQSGIVPGSAAPNPGVAITACSQMGLSGADLANCQASQAAGTSAGTPAGNIGTARRRNAAVSPQTTTQAPGTIYDSNGSTPFPATVVPGTGYTAPTLGGGTSPAGTGYKPPTLGGTPSSPSGTGYTAPSLGH